MRTAKSCGPDASTLASSFAEVILLATVTNKPDHRGDHEGNRKTIARGMPGCSGEPVVTTSCAFLLLHARLRVQRAPGIPCALPSRGWLFAKARAFSRRENAEVRLTFIVPAKAGNHNHKRFLEQKLSAVPNREAAESR